MAYETAQTTMAHRGRCEDRVDVISDGERTVIVVADGAGGVSSGDVAAESVIREVKSEYAEVESAQQWADVLKQIDARIGAGESTAVVVDLGPHGIRGASVGDSAAWTIHAAELQDLTRNQHRKPLLGSRNAQPVCFESASLAGTLIVATDGLATYVKRQELPRLVAQSEFVTLPRKLIELVQLPSGDFWDDIGIVVCRVRPVRRTRKQYQL